MTFLALFAVCVRSHAPLPIRFFLQRRLRGTLRRHAQLERCRPGPQIDKSALLLFYLSSGLCSNLFVVSSARIHSSRRVRSKPCTAPKQHHRLRDLSLLTLLFAISCQAMHSLHPSICARVVGEVVFRQQRSLDYDSMSGGGARTEN